LRGFDEYDAWQSSGVSGQGARSFYYPEQSQECNDCHMPLVRSDDQGNIDGFVHSHRFPAANTAVPFANRDDEQLRVTREFLQNGILTVDIFAATELEARTGPGRDGPSGAGREGEENAPSAAEEKDDWPVAASLLPDSVHGGAAPPASRARTASPLSPPPVAPLDRAAPYLQEGKAYRIDVVPRTRKIGHFFPGGTVDAFDVWLELKVEDADGDVLFWSGFVEDEGRGPLDRGAHRYGALLIDAHGNEINKRNAWAARAVVYARLIPPGAADVGRFRIAIPVGTRSPVTLTARMNYRKFSWWNTQFAYAGIRDPEAGSFELSPHYDDGPYVFTGDTASVSGVLKEIPILPIIVIAEDRVTLPLAAAGTAATPPAPQPFDRERFNDYGIGMFRQGDLSAAAAAFRTVTELAPDYADGFVNVARVLVREGNHDAAVPMLERALQIDPDLASAHYFTALALKARGRYDEALAHLRDAAARYPRDVVVRNQIGRVLFLQRRHDEAIEEFRQVLRVDPEDLTAHYNMMLTFRALGDADNERVHEALYTRFKADEAAQAITGPYRRRHPEDNLERQPIHEHENRYRPQAAKQQPGAGAVAGGAP
jgi:tetratricopeptide (TPR) repeat protein